MPITLPANLPAFDVLRNEGVMVMTPERAATQESRPLRIALLNLMPKKIQTENQFARLIGATPLQIDFHLIRMTEHQTKNTAAEHMETFYRPFAEVEASGEKFDGLVITGAPIEHLEYEVDGVRTRYNQSSAIVAPSDAAGMRFRSGVTVYTVRDGEIDAGRFIPLGLPEHAHP